MTERMTSTPEMPCDPLLSKIENVVETNPKLRVPMSNGITFRFSLGKCAKYGTAQTPRQVLMATTEGNALIAVLSSDPAENKLYAIEQAGGQKQDFDSEEAELVEDQDLSDLDDLMNVTDFNQESAVKGMASRLQETVAQYGNWMPMMTDVRPLVGLN